MGKYRMGRVNEEMMKVLADLLRRVKDPRVSDNFVSITEVQCAPDLRTAKVFYSHLSGADKDVQDGLVAAHGFLRRSLAQEMNMRMTPELHFVKDNSQSYAAHIDAVLSTLHISKEEPEEADKDGDGAGGNA